jgi:hypothetical protein
MHLGDERDIGIYFFEKIHVIFMNYLLEDVPLNSTCFPTRLAQNTFLPEISTSAFIVERIDLGVEDRPFI